MSEEKYLKLDNNVRILNEVKIFPERYMGKYVTFESKFNFLHRLLDDALESLRKNGGNPMPHR